MIIGNDDRCMLYPLGHGNNEIKLGWCKIICLLL